MSKNVLVGFLSSVFITSSEHFKDVIKFYMIIVRGFDISCNV